MTATLQVDIVPSQGEVSVGDSKFFLCTATGDVSSISWYLPDGKKIDPNQQRIAVARVNEISYSLTLYSAQIDDAGIYKCVATSKDGNESEATVNVKIYQKLEFRHAPSPQEFKVGDDAVVICDSVSSPPPTITWKHRGRDVLMKKDDRFTMLPNNYLQIRHIKKTDEGTYRCEGIIAARGEIKFKDIRVIVNVPPSIQPRDMVVNATAHSGQPVSLVCDSDGFPQPEVTWMRDDVVIEADGDKYIMNEDGSELTINKISKRDDGDYICIAQNKAGDAELEITLQVFVKPEITYVENKTAVELEEQITLTCEAKGDPTPTIVWMKGAHTYKDGEQASWTWPVTRKTMDGRIEVQSHARVSSLTLKDIQHTDSGQYICKAQNSIGQDSESMYLEVQYAPKLQGTVTVYTWEGNAVNITCEVLAHPVALVTWFRDGQQLPSSNYSSIKIYSTRSTNYLQVTPDSENDFGPYNCTASNRVGVESKEFILVQAETPSAPTILDTIPYSSTVQVKVEEPESTGGVPILKYLVEWKVKDTEEWFTRNADAREVLASDNVITVSGLTPETMYNLRLSAINGKGIGDASQIAEFKTEPVLFTGQPTTLPPSSFSPLDSAREPSPPKLEGKVLGSGNVFKVNWIKQDDGGSPIRHYLVRYKAKHHSDWKPEMRLPSDSEYVILANLEWNSEYEVYVVAENQQGKSEAGSVSFRTSVEPTVIPEVDPSDGSGLGTGAIVGILIVVFLILLVAVDVTCYFINKCGLLMCIAVNFCGQPGPGSKGKDMEEGKAAFSKDESKEPIVEVRTEEERTPNHDGGSQTEPNETTPLTEPEHAADTQATVEDMLPSVTTVTTNSDTITETFATAQNSPTSETTTLTSSAALPASTTPEPSPASAAPPHSPKAAVASPTSPSTKSQAETVPIVAPLVDLSDAPVSVSATPPSAPISVSSPPSSAPTSSNPVSNVNSNQAAAPPIARTAEEVTKDPANNKPGPVPSPGSPASPPATSAQQQPKPEAPTTTKSPEIDATKPNPVKSPVELTNNSTSVKNEAATDSSKKPSQGEDFPVDGGTFKTSNIDLAKDVFAALGTSSLPTMADGKAADLAPSIADAALPSAPAKEEKVPLEDKPKQEGTEVKTVPNEASQTNENESKA
ncbi:neural cell adhesion molecule 1 isoform X5 [Stegostoma tigrinum]|uniref:neural cell adhesion molecule 1 isoform X5 n=1 Tax=Stegostoma tigrinum TaxID=3053191 RepID=UPI00286FF49F|nr:neural cell adhesion molecule 1 isoform X5 [Stegostoma tigrinum]